MVRSYVREVLTGPNVANITKVHLLCKTQLIGLYEKCSFVLLGKSEVVHGADPWYEMEWRDGAA